MQHHDAQRNDRHDDDPVVGPVGAPSLPERSAKRAPRCGPVWRLPLALLALMLVATGCYKFDIAITVEEDGSGTIAGEFGVNPDQINELSAMFAGDGEDTEGFAMEMPSREETCAEFLTDSDTDLPSDVEATPFDDGTWCGISFSESFEASTDPGATIGESLDTDELSLRQDVDGGWIFETAELSGGIDEGETEGMPAPIMAALFEGIEIRYTVTLPGEPVEHNATSVEGSTFIWDIDLAEPVDTLFARTAPASSDDGGGSILPWILGIVVVAALAVGAVMFLRSRDDDADYV